MHTIETVLLIVHTFIAVLIIALVLLQRGKGADAGAAFGAGASGTVFGARGSASFFSRATAILATLFFASSLALAWFSSEETEAPDSLLERAPAQTPAEPEGEGDAGETGGTAEVPELPPAEQPPGEEAGEAAELPELVPAEEQPADEQPADEPPADEPPQDEPQP